MNVVEMMMMVVVNRISLHRGISSCFIHRAIALLGFYE